MGKHCGTICFADIKCYSDKQRTILVAQFKSFPEVRKFLKVQTVGDSLENASLSGNPSRGYYWRVENIEYLTPTEAKRKYGYHRGRVSEYSY